MERSTNALAKLAERLKKHLETTVYVSPQNRKDIVAAQRIVAELAKASARKDDHGVVMSYSEVAGTVERCRAIAEEGDRDGK